MGRGRGKGKKQTVVTHKDDLGSGVEEKSPVSKRRGRPQRLSKDELKENELVDNVENDDEKAKGSITSKSSKDEISKENGAKRKKRSSQVKENSDPVEENDSKDKSSTDDSVNSVGFRQNGSRRKSKPRRAAEVGVECQ